MPYDAPQPTARQPELRPRPNLSARAQKQLAAGIVSFHQFLLSPHHLYKTAVAEKRVITVVYGNEHIPVFSIMPEDMVALPDDAQYVHRPHAPLVPDFYGLSMPQPAAQQYLAKVNAARQGNGMLDDRHSAYIQGRTGGLIGPNQFMHDSCDGKYRVIIARADCLPPMAPTKPGTAAKPEQDCTP